ncbi:MAG: hypothetical protein RIS41_76, partial [Actinomycetota bacterium]
ANIAAWLVMVGVGVQAQVQGHVRVDR